MATEKQLANQITSTKNIMKITSSMKMVSAAKLKGDENRLHAARPFNKWSAALCDEPTPLDDTATFENIPDNSLIVPLTSDKGLCGGVNSFISRGVRDMMGTLNKDGKSNFDIVVVGEKVRTAERASLFVLLNTTTHISRYFDFAAKNTEIDSLDSLDSHSLTLTHTYTNTNTNVTATCYT